MTNGLNLKRFVAFYLGLSVGIPILLAVINRVAGVDLSSSAIGIIPIMIAAMDQGMQYGNRHETPATSQNMWRYAAVMGVIGVALSILVSAVFVLLSLDLRDLFTTVMGGVAIGVMLVIGLVLFPLLARWFFGQGMRNAHKVQAKKAKHLE